MASKEVIFPQNLFDTLGTSAQMEVAKRIGSRSAFGRKLFVCYVHDSGNTEKLLNEDLIYEGAVLELLACQDEESFEHAVAGIYADLCLLLAFISENQSTDKRIKTFTEADIDQFMEKVLLGFEEKNTRKIYGDDIEKINRLIRESFFGRIKFDKPKSY